MSSPSKKPRCIALTKELKQCTMGCKEGSTFCTRHENHPPEFFFDVITGGAVKLEHPPSPARSPLISNQRPSPNRSPLLSQRPLSPIRPAPIPNQSSPIRPPPCNSQRPQTSATGSPLRTPPRNVAPLNRFQLPGTPTKPYKAVPRTSVASSALGSGTPRTPPKPTSMQSGGSSPKPAYIPFTTPSTPPKPTYVQFGAPSTPPKPTSARFGAPSTPPKPTYVQFGAPSTPPKPTYAPRFIDPSSSSNSSSPVLRQPGPARSPPRFVSTQNSNTQSVQFGATTYASDPSGSIDYSFYMTDY